MLRKLARLVAFAVVACAAPAAQSAARDLPVPARAPMVGFYSVAGLRSMIVDSRFPRYYEPG